MMFRGKGEESFLDTVKMRYKTDLLMNGLATLFVLVMPIALMAIMFILRNFGGKYDILNDFEGSILMTLMMIQYLIVALVLFKIYNRLYAHSKRDRHWRAALIRQLENDGNLSYRTLGPIDENIRKKERFITRPLVILVFALLFIATSYFLVIYIPYMEANNYVASADIVSFVYDYLLRYTIDLGSGGDMQLMMFFSIQQVEWVLLAALFLLEIHKLIWFTKRHDVMQCTFTRRLKEIDTGKYITVGCMTEVPSDKYDLYGNRVFAVIKVAVKIIFTLGIYLIPWIYHNFKMMNDHFQKQWAYEEKMLVIIEGEEKMRGEGLTDFETLRYRPLRKNTNETTGKIIKFPRWLIVAEIFLLAICGTYCLKILATEFEMVVNNDAYVSMFNSLNDIESSLVITMAMVVVNLFLLMMTIDALMGIASRRPASWRKVTKTCITFIIPIWIGELITNESGLAHLFDFNPYITTGVLYNVLLLMILSVEIKKFYAPINQEMPGILTWIRYIFFGSLEKKNKADSTE